MGILFVYLWGFGLFWFLLLFFGVGVFFSPFLQDHINICAFGQSKCVYACMYTYTQNIHTVKTSGTHY